MNILTQFQIGKNEQVPAYFKNPNAWAHHGQGFQYTGWIKLTLIVLWLLQMFVIFSQVLVHGEQNEMGRLKAALIREYEDNPVSYARAMFCKY